MDQHPVPQNISSYEFRLVGDMTLKQFLQLAGGAGVGLIIFRLPLPDFIKWPLVIIAAGTGALMAFVPIQGRPFTQWLLAFIKAIYAPTEFYWNPNISTVQSPPKLGGETPLQRGGVVQPAVTVAPPSPAPLIPVPQSVPKPVEATPLSPAEVASFEVLAPNVAPQGVVGQTQYAKAEALPAEALAKAGPPPIPQPTTVNQTLTPKPTTYNPPPTTNLGPSPLTPSIHIAHPPSTTSSTTAPDIPPPSLPNILTGLVVTTQNQPQEGAIVEIVANATGLPVRALRTSKTGTFQIATPLPNGLYSLYIDKDGLTFDPVSVTAESKIIQPIIIKAKS